MSQHLKTLVCPKCQSQMTPGGFTVYRGIGWAPSIGSFFWSQPRPREIVVYCCDGCGYLEPYALPAGETLASVLPKR